VGIGSLFGGSSLASKIKPKKKKSSFGIHVDWPEVPAQEVKDYKAIRNSEELIAYLKRCEETGLCGFDYETTISDEYRTMCQAKMDEFMYDIDACKNEVDAAIEAVAVATNLGDKHSLKEAQKVLKETQSMLKASEKVLDDFVADDFLKAPLDPHKNSICTLSLSATPNEARVIFIGNQGRNQFGQSDPAFTGGVDKIRNTVFGILKEHFFSNPKIMKIAVNLSFETKTSLSQGAYISMPVADPLIMWVRCLQVAAPERIQDPKMPIKGKGLKPMTGETFGVKMSHFDEVLKEKGVQFFDEVSADDPDALSYSAEDSDYAVQHYLYWKQIAAQIPKYDEWLHTIEMPFTRVIGMMEYYGMPWDNNIANSKAKEAVKLRDDAIRQMVELGAKYGLKIEPGKTGKTASVQDLLFNYLKVPIASTSEKTGKPSLDAEALIDMKFMIEKKLYSLNEEKDMEGYLLTQEIAERPELEHKEDALLLLDLIQKVQTCTTLLSSHIVGRQKFVNPITGRIHASYSQWTETGRLNSFHPNGQNVPRADNDQFGIRSFFKTPKGKCMFLIDFSGFELRLMAWASGDEHMTEVFTTGDGDVHRSTAATITGKKREDVTKAERYRAKAPNFLISYGGTEYALRLNLKKKFGIRESLPECAKLIKAVTTTFPRIPEFQEKIALKARGQGYVQTIYGYIRMLPNINSYDRKAKAGDERRASNTPIQGSAADIMKRAQNEVYELIAKTPEFQQRAELCAQIHDEMILLLDDDVEFVERFATTVKALMERPPLPDFPVPIIAEADFSSEGWGSKVSFEKWKEQRENDSKITTGQTA